MFLQPLFPQDNVHVTLSFFVGVGCCEREMIYVQLKVVLDFNRDVRLRKLDRDGRNNFPTSGKFNP